MRNMRVSWWCANLGANLVIWMALSSRALAQALPLPGRSPPLNDEGGVMGMLSMDVLGVLVGVLSLAVAFLCLLMLLWRRVRLGKTVALVPEVWGAQLSKAARVFQNDSQKLYYATEKLTRHSQTHSEKILQMEETFMTFQKALDEKDAEIKRYKEGYDQQVFVKFLRRFVRLGKHIDKLIERNQNDKDFKNIKLLLKDALEECGVFSFAPGIGEDYRDLGKAVADEPSFENTHDSNKDFTIARVEEEGYKLEGTAQEVIILPARVVIYRYTDEA